MKIGFILFAIIGITFAREGVVGSLGLYRLVGGEFAEKGEFPFIASIRFLSHRCGGSLITKRHVLTAGHCIDHYSKGGRLSFLSFLVKVVVGITNLHDNGQEIDVESFLLHDKFDRQKILYDIGMIKLAKDIEESELASPIGLPTELNVPDNSDLLVVGFGTTNSGDPVENHDKLSNKLKKVTVCQIPRAKCLDIWGRLHGGTIDDKKFCTTTTRNVLGTCSGDSGGPIIYNNKIVGIVSYGFSYCAYGIPDVETNVGYYLDWIKDTIETSNSVNNNVTEDTIETSNLVNNNVTETRDIKISFD